jgi:hypothetical protein
MLFSFAADEQDITSVQMARLLRHLDSVLAEEGEAADLATVIPAVIKVQVGHGKAGSGLDGWGRQFLWGTTKDGNFGLLSYGRDGKSGGDGLDADIIRVYATRREDGTFWPGDPEWKYDSRRDGVPPYIEWRL